MKRIILLTAITVLAVTAKAQITTTLGIKAGVNLSGMTSKQYSESFRKPGFLAGILSEISISEKFSIQSELLYATYGAEAYITSYGGGPYDTYYSLDYLLLPIAMKFYLNQRLSIEFGPSFNLLVRDKAYRPGLPDLYDTEGNFLRSQSDIDPGARRFEFSGVVGVTYNLCNSWAASLRYTQGLSSVLSYRDERNNAFQLGLEYIF